MYLTDVLRGASLRGPSLRRAAAGNVSALGLVSLFTDVSSEMVTAVLPAYLVLGLHLSFAQSGILDGLYTGATAFTRLLGGYCADRFASRKLVAGIGYGMSALAKAGLLAVAGAPAAIGAVLVADRTGKGLRTAPRDAMIALWVDERDLGQAFGVHRMLDSTGAFLGPLAAIGLLALAGTTSYDSVFVGSLCAALIGLLILVLFVRNRPGPIGAPPVRLGSVRQLLGLSVFRRMCLVAALLGPGHGRRRLRLSGAAGPGRSAGARLPAGGGGTSLAFLILAAPLGRLADRVGRWPVIVGGYGCLFVVYLLLGFGHAPLAAIVLLYGAFYAATDGVLTALVVPAIPDHLKTTGLALVQTGQALAYLVSSVAFGLLWSSVGVGVACVTAAGAAAVLLPCCAWLLRPDRKRAAA